MIRKLGQKLVQGAKAEIEKEPIQLVNTEKILQWLEIAIPIGILGLSLIGSLKRNPEPTTIVINNYIQGVKQ